MANEEEIIVRPLVSEERSWVDALLLGPSLGWSDQELTTRYRLTLLCMIDQLPPDSRLSKQSAKEMIERQVKNHFGRTDQEWVGPRSLSSYLEDFNGIWDAIRRAIEAGQPAIYFPALH